MRGIARDAGLGGGVLALGLASTLATVWVMGIQADRDRYQAEAAQPRPTVTKTRTQAPVVHRPPHSSPSGSSSGAGNGVALVAAAGEASRTSGGTAEDRVGDRSIGGAAPPSPARPAPPASGSSSGTGASVHLPLGVLPDVDVTVGGSK